MGEIVRLRFSTVEEYVNSLNRIFGGLSESQDEITGAYNRVTELWSDKVSSLTGQGLQSVGKTLADLHGEMSATVERLNRRCEGLSHGYAEREWNAVFITREFQTALRKDTEIDMDTINGTTVEGIKSFERAFAEYIENTKKNVMAIRNAHERVHDGWRDEQYDRTTVLIEEFLSSMGRQLNTLEVLQGWIETRRKEFEKALEESV